MAIPIVFPNSEEAEDSYRSLDLLLEQLLITLRQVLMHRRREAAANAYLQTVRHRLVQSDITPVEETSERLERGEEFRRESRDEETACAHSNLPLPDVVLQTTQDSSHQEQKESARTSTVGNVERSETSTTTTTTTTTAQTHTWVQVGGDLKRIDEQIVATNRLDQNEDKKGKMKDETKETTSILSSLFCPPLGSSVWTAMVLLVGWGLISRTR